MEDWQIKTGITLLIFVVDSVHKAKTSKNTRLLLLFKRNQKGARLPVATLHGLQAMHLRGKRKMKGKKQHASDEEDEKLIFQTELKRL